MNRVYTEQEYEELYVAGTPPQNCMKIVKHALYALPYGIVQQMLKTQNIVVFDRDNFGTKTAAELGLE